MNSMTCIYAWMHTVAEYGPNASGHGTDLSSRSPTPSCPWWLFPHASSCEYVRWFLIMFVGTYMVVSRIGHWCLLRCWWMYYCGGMSVRITMVCYLATQCTLMTSTPHRGVYLRYTLRERNVTVIWRHCRRDQLCANKKSHQPSCTHLLSSIF